MSARSTRVPRALAMPLLLALVHCTPATRHPPPNIVLLVLDCLRADRYGAAEPYPRALTPNLDQVLDEGTRFVNAFAQASWTRPSIPTMLTGLYPAEHGLGDFELRRDSVTGAALSPSAVTVAEGLKTLGYATAMFGQQNQLAPRFGLVQGFDAYVHKSGNAQRTHRRFLQWLQDGVEDEQPFFAYLHYLELHWPYCPPKSTRGRFTSDYAGRSFCRQWRKLRTDLRSGAVVLNDEELHAMVSYYDEQVLGLDLEIGRLFEALRQRGLWEETLIVVTSDHGEEFFEHGGMGHGTSLFDELIRVPLVLKPPASWGTAPVGIDGLVELRSVTPTLLEAAGAKLAEPLGSLSVLPSLHGTPQETRPFIVSEHALSVAIRTADLKLVANREDGSVLLFDLVADPLETQNVAQERPLDVARLQGFLRDWQRSLRRLPATFGPLDDETVEGLRKLGYLD